MADMLSESPAAFAILAGIVGLLVGSFLNVVVHRLPRRMEHEWRREARQILAEEAAEQIEGENGEAVAQPEKADKQEADSPPGLIYPRSHCPNCGHGITALENIPVLSYAWLRGRCSACGVRISARYPAVELLTGILSAAVAWWFGFGVAAGGALLLTWALVALTFIDLDTMQLPDVITLPFLWLGLVFNLFSVYTDLESAVVGAMVGYLTLWLVFHAFKLLTGKEGMGYGDFKLLALLGAWQGWEALPVVILLASLVGSVVGVTMIAIRGHDRNVPIPFGPYLAAAGWLALLWGPTITNAYLGYTGTGG